MRRKIPSTGALAAFEAAARHCSYTLAADELAVTQSAVCRQVAALEDFLGGATPWIDLFMKQGAGYLIKANGEHKFCFNGNWKIQLENTTDGYHFPVVHKSWMKSIDD